MEASARPNRHPALLISALALLLVGLSASLYLAHLYLEVHASGGAKVESFCSISDGWNCVTVAESRYSLFLGIPIAFYGVQYFALALLFVLGAGLKWLRVQSWQSLLFLASALSLPASAILAWVSHFYIHSMCILCTVVHGVNVALFTLLLIANRKRLGSLVKEGPAELIALVKASGRNLALAIAAAAAVASQFVWMPSLVEGKAQAAQPEEAQADGTPRVAPTAWLEQPISGLSLGPADAPVQIEEFTDFQCPFCSRAHQVMLEVIRRYPGKIHLTHRDFPLDNSCNPSIPKPFHAYACQAAYYARCAAKQGWYWPYEEKVFKNQEQMRQDGAFLKFGQSLGLSTEQMKACMASEEVKALVRQDIEEGIRRKIEGTPTLFVNGEAIVGAQPLAFWEKKIGELVAAPKGSASAAASGAASK